MQSRAVEEEDLSRDTVRTMVDDKFADVAGGSNQAYSSRRDH